METEISKRFIQYLRLESAKVILAQAGELIIWSITENFMCRVTGEFHIREIRLPIKIFLLTLLGIAKELELNPNIEKGDLIQVQMPIGLPPKHFAELYDKYETFFRGTGEMLQFNYKQKEYHVTITDVMAFPQDYAAIMLQHREIRSYPKVVGVDIGGFTTDYLMFRSGIEDMEICDSMETGIISLYNRITARMRADYDVLLEEADIDSIIQGKKGFYEEKVVRAVLQEANQCGL